MLVSANLMAVLQIVVLTDSLDFETAVATKKYIACGNQDFFVAECDAAQISVATAALEINLALVPVEELLNLVLLKIDRKYAALPLAWLVAAHDRCRNEFW